MMPHTAIPVTDLKCSIQFYQRLGFTIGKEWERPEWKMQGCLLQHPSGLNVELILHPKNSSIQFPAVPEVLHLALPVADLQAKFQELLAAGVVVVRPITEGVTVKQLAFIQDPDGFSIELFEPNV